MNFWKDGQIKPADGQYNNSLTFNRYWTEINTSHYSIIKTIFFKIQSINGDFNEIYLNQF